MLYKMAIDKGIVANDYCTFDAYRSFMSDFFEIFNIIKPKLSFSSSVSKKLLVIISSDQSNASLSEYINSKYVFEKDNIDLFCLSSGWFNDWVWSWFNILWCWNIRKDTEESDFEDLFCKIDFAIDNQKYRDISVCFVDTSWNISDLDLFPICSLDLNYFSSRFDLNFEEKIWDIDELCILPWQEDIQKNVIKQYIQHIIYWLILEQRYLFIDKSFIKSVFNEVIAVI